MTNDGIIEGDQRHCNSEAYAMSSDLSLAIGYAGRWTNIPDGDYLFGGSGVTLRAVLLRKPAIEKKARLRSQHFIFSRSRMGQGVMPMLMRGMQPWPSVCIPQLLEAGRLGMKMQELQRSGGQ